MDKFTRSLETVNSKINDLQGKKNELEELDKIIESKNNEYKELESHDKKYLEANTLLKSSPDESKIKDELYTISGKINLEEEKLKEYIASDSNLSLDMSDETLDDLIKDLSKKDTRYHVLMGSVKSKEEYEKKLNLKSEEIAQKENDINVIKKAIESSPYN